MWPPVLPWMAFSLSEGSEVATEPTMWPILTSSRT